MDLQNFCSQENGVRVIHVTSNVPNCPISNILVNERKQLWMSQAGLPQSFTLDLNQMQDRPKFIKCFGFDCWHDYQSNPSVIELLVSTDAQNYITWTTIYPELRQGIQLFQIDPLGRRYNNIKVLVRETFGASKTYMNQIFLLEDYVHIPNESMSEHTEKSQSKHSAQPSTDQEQQNQNQRHVRAQTAETTLHHQRLDEINDKSQKINDKEVKTSAQKTELSQFKIENQTLFRQDQQQKLILTREQYRYYAPPRNYAKPEELQEFPMLTSTEKEVRLLKEEINNWRVKFETMRQSVQNIEHSIQKLFEQNFKQQQQIPSTPKPPKNQQNSQMFTLEQVEVMIERSVTEKIQEQESRFQVQFQLQEQRFKQQQLDLISKIKTQIYKKTETDEDPQKKQKIRSHSRGSAKRRSQSKRKQESSSSDKENYDSHNKSRNYKNERIKSYNSKTDKSKRVTDLLHQLQEKLQQRAKKVEELQYSSNKKTRKRKSIRRQSSSSDPFDSSSDRY